MKKQRIVTLLPAATEMVCALGAGNGLVGRSHECDYPATVLPLPACTSARFDTLAGSGELDRQVKDALKAKQPLYRIDAELLQQLQPDLIITQGQCDVCAVSLADVEKAFSRERGPRPQILSLAPNRLADIWEDMRRVADALGCLEDGRDVIRALKNRVVTIIEKTCVLKQRPTVACLEWFDPLMAAGNWVPELVELAGGSDVAGEPGKHSAWMEWDALTRAEPEHIILMPCGFDLKRTRAASPGLAKQPAWARLRAVRKGRVALVDGNQFFNRPGPRVVESLEILAEILNPKLFNFGHQGRHWEPI